MKCPRCQAENPPGMRFCGQCAASLAAVCPSCGSANPHGNKFCGQCATPLDGSKGSRFSAPEAYTPKHLAERIINSKAAMEGERKQVTVLFADLKGSMELLADRDPEEARQILDPVLGRMMEAVHRYEGTVNQVMGDGIMALFGAPLAHEDHAVRACYAALRMQAAVRAYADEARRTTGLPPAIRVGLNSGEVVVRSIGSDLRMDYTAVGQTTHLAARMEQAALPGTIVITADTLKLAEGWVQVTPLGAVPVKGLTEPAPVYEVTGAGAARTRLEAAARRGLTRFVGRSAELEQLRGALDRASEGRGQVVAVVGEPGVGKSRLFWELTHSHRVHGWLIVQSASVSYGKATAYLPVIELLRGYFEIESRDDPRKIREKVTGKVLTLAPALGPAVPALLSLLDVPVDEAAWQALDPLQRRQQTLDAVQRLLLRESEVQPLVVVFEDLHWIDGETQALLDTLIESLPAARLLLLVNYRPEYSHAWGGRTYYRQLRIDPLPLESADELLDALLGTDAALGPLKQLLIERTEANPLFLEESVRALVEMTALAGEGGAYRLTRPVEHLTIPATVQAILAARIDRLAPEAKRLLQTAAVIGKDVPLLLLHAVAEATEEAVNRGLTRLQAAEFLYEKHLPPDAEYTFKHALTHEVTYGTLLHQRRKVLHGRIVGAIERAYPDRLIEHVERLAHHAMGGEMWEQAVTYLRQAGAKALTRSANREAVTYFDRALTALRHLPETREALEQAIDLRFDLRTALHPLGEFERILGCLREAEGLARTLGDQRRLGQMSVYMCHTLWMAGHPTEALGFGRDAQAIAESLQDVPLQVTGNLYLGAACLRTGDYQRAEDLLRRVLQLLEGDPRRERFGLPGFPAVIGRCYLTLTFAERGAFEEGIAHAQEGIRVAEALGHPYSLSFACWILAYLHLIRGDLGRAVHLLERGIAVSREWNLTYFSVTETGSLGYAYALSGRMAEGLPLLERTLSSIESMHGNLQLLFLLYLGEAHLLGGRLADALAFAGRALTFAREGGQRGYEAWALRLLGEVSARRDPPEHAGGHYRDALALAEKLGMRPLVAHCHLGLGKLFRRPGEREQAREHLATATTMYREMGMTCWLEKAEVEMRDLE